jgi:hypothetical protein
VPLPITSSKISHLVDALERAYRVLGLEDAAWRRNSDLGGL